MIFFLMPVDKKEKETLIRTKTMMNNLKPAEQKISGPSMSSGNLRENFSFQGDEYAF